MPNRVIFAYSIAHDAGVVLLDDKVVYWEWHDRVQRDLSAHQVANNLGAALGLTPEVVMIPARALPYAPGPTSVIEAATFYAATGQIPPWGTRLTEEV